MEFIQHTLNWAEGEIFEGICVSASGIAIILLAIAFWQFGGTEHAKSLVIPLIVVGFIFTAFGAAMVWSNQARIPQLAQSYQEDAEAFVHAEKDRVASFQSMYTIMKGIATLLFIVAIAIFWLSESGQLQAVALGLILLALGGLTLDHFSKERAAIYYQNIENELAQREVFK